MIILDFSQIVRASILVESQAQECAKNPSESSKSLLKHCVFSSIKYNYNSFKKTYSKMVIACDSRSFRYDIFPEYKHKRATKQASDSSGISWSFVREVTEEIISELRDNFPFYVVKVSKAEGDDIIGTLTKHITNNLSAEVDLFGEAEVEKILILSSDRDNFQLHKFKNVRQYSMLEKKMIRPEVSWKESFVEKIVKGDPGDGIPSIKSADDTFVTGTRQKPISAKYLKEFIDSPNPLDVCLTESEKVNFERNMNLISYDRTPIEIQEAIISCYNEQVNKSHSKMALMNYLSQNKMSNLLSNIHDFY